MPKMDGWTVCREIRKISQVPVIMLTARGEEYDKLFGFELGVDDYMVKPFSPKELLARMKVIIRRSTSADESISKGDRIGFDGLVIEFNSRNVYVDGSIMKTAVGSSGAFTAVFFVKNYIEILTYLLSRCNIIMSICT